MEKFNLFFYIFQILISTLFLVVITEGTMAKKNKNRWCILFFWAYCGYDIGFSVPVVFKFSFSVGMMILWLHFFLQIDWKKSICYSGLYHAIKLVSEIFAMLSVGNFTVWIQSINFSTVELLFNPWEELLAKSFYFVYFTGNSVIYIITQSKMDRIRKIKTNFIAFSMMVFQSSFFFHLNHVRVYSEADEHIMISIFYCVMSVVIYGSCIFDMNVVFARKEKQLETMLISTEKDRVMRYYQLANLHAEETRKLKHDLSNQIQCLHALVHTDIEKAKEFSRELQEIISEPIPIFTTGNSIVDTILTIKLEQGKQFEIPMEIKADEIGSAVISDMDMCNLLSNIFTNAMDASLHLPVEMRKIYFSIGYRGEYVVITCRNNYQGDLVIKNGKYLSGKRKFLRQGYGMKILEQISKKYRGNLVTTTKDGEFQITVLLKILLKITAQ